MKFSNTFKFIWWIFLILLTGALFIWRLDAIYNGDSAPIDIFIFLILIALLLAPIFAEIEFFGIKLKQEIKELKDQIKIQIGDLKNEIRNSQVQTIHQNISGFGPPPKDEELPELELKVEKIIKRKFQDVGLKYEEKTKAPIKVPEHNLFLFSVRYNIETELRRIWENSVETYQLENRKPPLFNTIKDLREIKLIDTQLYHILREILAICNYGIHGENISQNQIDFVYKNADEVIELLSRIE